MDSISGHKNTKNWRHWQSDPTTRSPSNALTLCLDLRKECRPLRIAEILDLSRQTVYNWAQAFRHRSQLELTQRLRDAPRSGRPATALRIIDPLLDTVIDDDPRDHGYHATVWTAPLLRRYLEDVHAIVTSRKSVSRALSRLRIRWKRPRHRLARRPPTWQQAKGG